MWTERGMLPYALSVLKLGTERDLKICMVKGLDQDSSNNTARALIASGVHNEPSGDFGA
jgi:hypothetical protein